MPENKRLIYFHPTLDELEDGEEVVADLQPNRAGPGDPAKREFRLYYRREDQLFYTVLKEVR